MAFYVHVRGVGGQKGPKFCPRSVWTTPNEKLDMPSLNNQPQIITRADEEKLISIELLNASEIHKM